MSRIRRSAVTLLALALSIPIGGAATASSPSADAGVVAPHESSYGASYVDWASRYLRWFQVIPSSTNPAADPDSPRNCAERGNVVFLGPSGTGHGCDVEAGKAVLFTYTGAACYTTGPHTDTFPKLDRCVTRSFAKYWGHGRLVIKVDGDRVPRTRRWTVKSHHMTVDYPEDNIWGIRPGPRMNVNKLVLLMLEPPALGDHLIVGRYVRKSGKVEITRFPFRVR